METNVIEPTSFWMGISEYGKLVRQYADINKERFDRTTKFLINEHLDKYSNQEKNGVKNVTIQYHTY